jgi:hypothetical protein
MKLLPRGAIFQSPNAWIRTLLMPLFCSLASLPRTRHTTPWTHANPFRILNLCLLLAHSIPQISDVMAWSDSLLQVICLQHIHSCSEEYLLWAA